MENFRTLQAFCSHDLRSQLGAAAGLMQILLDDPKLMILKNHPNFMAALSSASEALGNLDQVMANVRLGYKLVWIGTELGVPSLEEQGLLEQDPARLFVRFQNRDEMLAGITQYRPAAVFVDERFIVSEFESFIRRIGPQLVKIFLVRSPQAPPMAGLPSGLVTIIDAPLTWRKAHAALAGLDGDRSLLDRAIGS